MAAKAPDGRGRGRVVMLVDNAVHGDSRVQKQARSMAERGWDVVLVGSAGRAKRLRWKIGDARVRLVQVPFALGHGPWYLRRSVRVPLAYPPGRRGAWRETQERARAEDLRARRARASVVARREGSTPVRRAGVQALRARSLLGRVRRRWVGLRLAQSQRLADLRGAMDSPIDAAVTSFWSRLRGPRAWRNLDTTLWDYELAFGPVVDRLKPDVLHANDFRMIGIGARAVWRARAAGREVALVWDAHEYLPGDHANARNPRWHRAHVLNEQEFVGDADAVTTVSAELATLLRDLYDLPELPGVVLNAPDVDVDAPPPPSSRDLREDCGIGAETPLIVYAGSASPLRGLDSLVEALAHLPGHHLALVVGSTTAPYVRSLVDRAEELGAAGRVHLLPYVEADEVVSYVAGADVGVHPTLHFPNHEISLATKFFEYAHARLPMVVSDVRTMAEAIRSTGCGEVFTAEDPVDLARAVSAVLADPDRYRKAYDAPGLLAGWTWDRQADVLDEVYARVVPASAGRRP